MSLTQSKEVNSLSKRYSTHIERRITRTVMVGDVAIGSDYPVRVQSMINEDTMDVENAYLAIKRLHDVGCEIVRLTVPSLAHAKAVGDIKAKLLENNINTPLVADVHHNGMKIAMEVAKHVDKVRIILDCSYLRNLTLQELNIQMKNLKLLNKQYLKDLLL